MKFIKSDLLADISKEERFDVILANLPYVDKAWDWLESPESAALKYEPSIALYAEDGGLELIFRLVDEVFKRQRTKFLILEADPSQHKRIIDYAREKSLVHETTAGFQLLFSQEKQGHSAP